MTARGVVVICVKVRYLNSHDNWHDFKTVIDVDYRFVESERGSEIKDKGCFRKESNKGGPG